jgi:TPP-dependent trihydroxycyclohexane-1,2-dione (THcHDO) dehydratase
MRLTVAQALVRFLANQYSERDGAQQRLIPGCFGIFGHGNVAGVGQALLQEQDAMPYVPVAEVSTRRARRARSTTATSSTSGPS